MSAPWVIRHFHVSTMEYASCKVEVEIIPRQNFYRNALLVSWDTVATAVRMEVSQLKRRCGNKIDFRIQLTTYYAVGFHVSWCIFEALASLPRLTFVFLSFDSVGNHFSVRVLGSSLRIPDSGHSFGRISCSSH